MACSVAARGNILLAARTGEAIPPGWALDRDGVETTDAVSALAGSILPFAGHKGLAVAMVVETLAASLTGAIFAERGGSGSAQAANALLLVFNPAFFGDQGAYESHMRAWTGHVRKVSAAHHRIPGERAHEAEMEARTKGILLLQSIQDELLAIGERMGLRFEFRAV
jgi:LDH2 family malate/lactate/ureidoglycolate dehydrogenase